MTLKPWWKGEFVNRKLLKEMLESGFDRMATEEFDVALGQVASDVEHYVATQVMTNTKEALSMVLEEVKSALASIEEFEKQMLRERVKLESERRQG